LVASQEQARLVSDPLRSLQSALSDRYSIDGELGHGGMATVYRGRDLKLDRPVAIKVIRPELSVAVARERFVREARLAAKLQHPNILPVFDSGDAGGLLFYVMPLVEGESLRERLEREGQLPIEDALQIGREVAEALAYAHRHHVVHRDIKPDNILLSGGHALVADFGIARAVGAAAGEKLTDSGLVVGTPMYMSPEQGSAHQPVDARSDIYSLGCVIYEMFAGAPPFSGPSAQVVLARHSLDAVPPLRTARQTVPVAIEAAILRALAKAPADRFTSAELFARALSGTDAGTIAPAPTRRIPLRRVAIGLAAVLVLVAVWAARSWLRVAPATITASGLDPRHIAVRYFEDLSRGKTLGYIADGLTEALIGRLAEVDALDVISKNGVAPYRSSGIPRDSIARGLKVGSIVEGSVEDVGQRLRVTVRLVDGASGADIGRTSFERPQSDVLRVRDELAEQVATFLRRRLGEEVRLQEQKAGTRSVAAWLLVQQAEKAKELGDSVGRAGDLPAATRALAGADSLLASAEAADPAWLEPVVLRAAVGYQHSRPPFPRDPTAAAPWIAVGLQHAGRALQRDASSARAHELRGTLKYWSWLLRLTPGPEDAAALFGDAEQDLRAAVRLDPSLASAWASLSHLDATKSDLVQAKLDAQRAYEADAYVSAADVIWRLYTTSYDLGQFADAVHWCDEGQRRFPNTARDVECQLWLLTTKAKQPDGTAAWRLVSELQQRTPESDWVFARLKSQMMVAAVLARAGLGDSARRVAIGSRAGSDVDPSRSLVYYEAFVRTLLGDRDDALRLLKEYLAANPEQRADLAQDYQWWFRDLRDDPRYRELAGTLR
jgi:serine/threonine-protein kinase